MTTKRFCNKCKKECTGEKMTFPGKMVGGYFILWRLLGHTEHHSWSLCRDCLDSFVKDFDIFLKKQGYKLEDFQDFSVNCIKYFN